MFVGIWVVKEGPLGRAFLSPGLEGGELLECRQVVAAARCDQFLDRSRLRQMRQQALSRLLVLGEIPHGPEIWKKLRKPALWSRTEAVGPALFGDWRRSAPGVRPGARRVHVQCALYGEQ